MNPDLDSAKKKLEEINKVLTVFGLKADSARLITKDGEQLVILNTI